MSVYILTRAVFIGLTRALPYQFILVFQRKSVLAHCAAQHYLLRFACLNNAVVWWRYVLLFRRMQKRTDCKSGSYLEFSLGRQDELQKEVVLLLNFSIAAMARAKTVQLYICEYLIKFLAISDHILQCTRILKHYLWIWKYIIKSV